LITPYFVYPFLVALLWGTLVILIKDTKAPAVYGIGIGLTGAVFFVVLAALIFAVPLSVIFEPKITLIMITIGLSRYLLATWFFYESIKTADISVTTPIVGSKIIIVTIISLVMGLEALSILQVIAIILATAGFITITFHIRKLEKMHRASLLKCISFALAATLCWSVGDIFVKKINYINPLTITLGSLFFAWIIYFIFILSLKKCSWVLNMSKFDKNRYFLHGVLSLALTYFLLNLSLVKFGIIRTNIVTHLWPLIASLVGYIRYREKLFFSKICGAIMLVTSFILVIFS